MQIIKLGETTAAQIEIPFTTVLSTNLQSRISGATLANAAITVWIKKANVTTAVAGGAGTFTATDDTNAPGVRGYRPAVAELVQGVSTFIFTGVNMEPREVPVMVIVPDPFTTTDVKADVTAAVWANVLENGHSAANIMRGLIRGMVGKLSGVVLNTPKYRNLADTKDSITGTVTADGRTSVTLDLT